MTLEKPAHIAENEELSAIWDALTSENDYKTSDIPTLEHMCFTHLAIRSCETDLIGKSGKVHVALPVTTETGAPTGKFAPMPQVAQRSQLLNDYRADERRLGISADNKPVKPTYEKTVLYEIRNRQANTANTRNSRTA